MKINSFNYLTKEGIKNVWVNRLMTLSSVGVLVACMVLIGLALMLSLNVTKIIGDLEKQNVVMAYLDDYNAALYDDDRVIPEGSEVDENGISEDSYTIHNEAEAKAVCDEIAALDNVASAEYVSKEQGLEDVKKNMLEGEAKYFTFLDEENGNPLSDAVKVTMNDLSYFNETVEAISKVKGVESIQSQNDLADKINSIKDGVFIAGIAIISILLIISLVIVSNTIRVTMYNRKLEISIMKAVGATDAFIKLPFVVEGITIGIISAVLAEGILYCCYRVATEAILSNIGSYSIISFSSKALTLFGVFAGIGVLAGSIGSIIMIGKYLRREGSEFTAI